MGGIVREPKVCAPVAVLYYVAGVAFGSGEPEAGGGSFHTRCRFCETAAEVAVTQPVDGRRRGGLVDADAVERVEHVHGVEAGVALGSDGDDVVDVAGE